ncbi:hypothetical protein [Gallibacterium sp. AGMB14963]|uniref:hypothetical protein n=1 Tax=Gallibacterium faecale TaxID=3019086 RepID=UPI0022F1A55A|nr:hypothetical protein [Gallibacterium sp. AGMB14963]MDA3979544.1 hypothetical protein [Gallibacterium sp. AGMB14963]
MKFEIKKNKVVKFSIEDSYLENDMKVVDGDVDFFVSSWLLAPYDSDNLTLFPAEVRVDIKSKNFNLYLSHFFDIQFETDLNKDKWNSIELKRALLLNLYPQSRAFIVSTLASGGYGSINIPLDIHNFIK